jgi:sporulation protein YlmC with PRC-barrel domain
VELSQEPAALSDLIGHPVHEQSGRRLGRVWEIRGHRERDGSIVFDELLIGRAGLWRRLHGPREADRGVPWEAVTSVDDDRIVVRW